jgi:hypothetical protein
LLALVETTLPADATARGTFLFNPGFALWADIVHSANARFPWIVNAYLITRSPFHLIHSPPLLHAENRNSNAQKSKRVYWAGSSSASICVAIAKQLPSLDVPPDDHVTTHWDTIRRFGDGAENG